jgi:hypothetical protein
MQQRGEAAVLAMPDALRDLPRSAIPLTTSGMLGVTALRAFGTQQTTVADNRAAAKLDFTMPASLGALMDGLASPGHGVILAMGKGGVGKTTVAAAVAVGLAELGLSVHLSTTDPAAHVAATMASDALPNLSVSRIDPAVETKKYSAEVMQSAGAGLDVEGQSLLAEDLRSPCTEEIAVFRAFAEAVAEGTDRFVVLDTAGCDDAAAPPDQRARGFCSRKRPPRAGTPGRIDRVGSPLLLDDRDIGALGDTDTDFVVATGARIVCGQVLADAPCLDPHDGIGLRVEIVIAAEDLKRDRVGLDPLGPPCQRFVDDEAKEAAASLRPREFRTGDDPLQGRKYRFATWLPSAVRAAVCRLRARARGHLPPRSSRAH